MQPGCIDNKPPALKQAACETVPVLILCEAEAAVLEILNNGSNGVVSGLVRIVHQWIAAGIQAVAGIDDRLRAGSVPVLCVNSGTDDGQPQCRTCLLDGGVAFEIGQSDLCGLGSSAVLDGCVARTEIVIYLLIAPAGHMLVGLAVVLDAEAGVFICIPACLVAGNIPADDKESGLAAACAFKVVYQSCRSAVVRPVVKGEINIAAAAATVVTTGAAADFQIVHIDIPAPGIIGHYELDGVAACLRGAGEGPDRRSGAAEAHSAHLIAIHPDSYRSGAGIVGTPSDTDGFLGVVPADIAGLAIIIIGI